MLYISIICNIKTIYLSQSYKLTLLFPIWRFCHSSLYCWHLQILAALFCTTRESCSPSNRAVSRNRFLSLGNRHIKQGETRTSGTCITTAPVFFSLFCHWSQDKVKEPLLRTKQDPTLPLCPRILFSSCRLLISRTSLLPGSARGRHDNLLRSNLIPKAYSKYFLFC